MLTYELKKKPGVPLYEALYRCIRQDILSGNLKPGEKLPSKRALAAHLELGKITVEAAYAQLLSEGYIRSREKVGFFVEAIERPPQAPPPPPRAQCTEAPPLLDLTANGTGHFPFSVWSKLQREVILDYGRALLLPLPSQGIPELREAIAAHLAAFRGMAVQADNILVGAGTDFLYNLLIQLLGRDRTYAVEEPGYGKIRQIYAAGGVRCISAPMDEQGVIPRALAGAQVLHISPSHHFPTGLVTPLGRRQELLSWAGTENWVIEDDYDSEFRFASHPLPALQSLRPERVIYINSFSKSLAPSIRISYMVLPETLLPAYEENGRCFSATVSKTDQKILEEFMRSGAFERHLNRMRAQYKGKHDLLIRLLKEFGREYTVSGENAGVHVLVHLPKGLSEAEAVQRAKEDGVRVYGLERYCIGAVADPAQGGTVLLGYAGLSEEEIAEAAAILKKCWNA